MTGNTRTATERLDNTQGQVGASDVVDQPPLGCPLHLHGARKGGKGQQEPPEVLDQEGLSGAGQPPASLRKSAGDVSRFMGCRALENSFVSRISVLNVVSVSLDNDTVRAFSSQGLASCIRDSLH